MHAFPPFALILGSSLLPLRCRETLVATLAPVPELAFVLQCAAIGTAVGSAIALRAKRRSRDADTWAITTSWATLGLVIGLLVLLVSAIG